MTVVVRKSNISGYGVFATCKNAENVYKAFEKTGSIGTFVNDYKETKWGRKTNHSVNPNAKCVLLNDDVWVQALRDIKDEEVICDYRQLLQLFSEDKTIRLVIPIPNV